MHTYSSLARGYGGVTDAFYCNKPCLWAGAALVQDVSPFAKAG